MPLSLPNLDDRRYADLVEEARALIPSQEPAWTNHNPSDPGITLVEMFAFLAEMLIYRTNRVTDDNIRAFLKLINGPKWTQKQPLDVEIRNAVLDLRSTARAVTPADYEMLAVAAHPKAARALCLPRRNLDAPGPFTNESPGHVSVVVAHRDASAAKSDVDAMLSAVRTDLETRKLLTTRLHVVAPRYVTLRVLAELNLKPGAKGETSKADTTKKDDVTTEADATTKDQKSDATTKVQKGVVELAVEALKEFFDPLRGGPERKGWPFGRSIYVSDIYALLDALPGVDYVSLLDPSITLEGRGGEAAGDPASRRKLDEKGNLYAFELQPDELVRAKIEQTDIKVKRPNVTSKAPQQK